MPKKSLTEARVRMLKPRKSARDIRDGKLRGFGVRVLPSGRKRFFIHCQYAGERIWKTIGGTETMTVGEARFRAGELLVAIRRGEGLPAEPEETLFETIAGIVFRRYERVWKAGTLAVNRGYLQNQLLPYFAGRQIAEIERQDVRNWFASLGATPVAANRSMPVLSIIMREAEQLGLRPRDSNPCRGIRRNPRKGRERFLTDEELRRLSASLRAHEERRPLQVAAVRLLLLTGCRKGEILTLRWSDYRDGHLFLRDSKTGPRTVWLSQPARDILDRLKRRGRWVFRAPRKRGPRCAGWLDGFWREVRAEAELADVRLHDLRHTHASLALRKGETVLAIARLLGHGSAETTLKYAHPADPMARQAMEALGSVLEG
ncbi:MAG: tyrosine-type recombinase/integrase [Defluviicoccus sp.]|nr:tyrosine-type recombinase/integrase [Defluviicoccus sp.]